MGANEGDTSKLLGAVYPEVSQATLKGVTWFGVWVFIVGTRL